MMRLFLCEKPSQGKDIAKVLGATMRSDGCFHTIDKKTCVTWAIGHLVEQLSPADYDPIYKKWNIDCLPIIPERWQVSAKASTKKQYNIVMKLIKNAALVVIATDIDREGETIARELLELAAYKGDIQRLWLSALDDASIRKALNSLKPNLETLPLYHAGLARSRADWLIGMNFSRLFTLLAQQRGLDGKVLSVGRVQSPTLALVVNREREITQFEPKSHFNLHITLTNSNEPFLATYLITEQNLDENGLCLDKNFLEQKNKKISQAGFATVLSIETKREKKNAPMLFSLSDLQTECNHLYGLGAQQVLDIAQSLYETHKATTYPRTDCGYLPESQFVEVPKVINSLITSDAKLKNIIPHLNLQQKSRVWNDQKITAHHGIIPTMGRVNINKMSVDEYKIYDLIRRRYLAQFLPLCETDKTVINLDCADETLITKGNITIVQGWKILFGRSDDENEQKIPQLTKNQQCQIINSEIKTLQTKPPQRYTEGTLLSAMKNAARYVTDSRLKQKLRETEGLGTEATRAGLIQSLFDKGFITKNKKQIIPNPEGVMLIDILPDVLKDPGLTALWEQALNDIADSKMTLNDFMQKQILFVQHIVKNTLQQGIKLNITTS